MRSAAKHRGGWKGQGKEAYAKLIVRRQVPQISVGSTSDAGAQPLSATVQNMHAVF